MAQAKTTQRAKKPPKKASKRVRLVEAAAECFREGGVRATTIKIIAERAEVPIGNVYYYFKTKEDFASAVVDSLAQSQADAHARWEEMEPPDALRGYVRHALSSPASLSRHGGGVESLVRDLCRESSTSLVRARALLRAEEDFVERCFRRHEQEAESPFRAKRLAQWLVMSVRGARAHAHLTGDARVVSVLRGELLARLKARLS